MSQVDLDRLQKQYEVVGRLLGSLGETLDEAKVRLSEIAEIRRAYTSPDPKMDEYHQRTMDLLEGTLARYGEIHDLMLQCGTDAIKKMGQT